MMNEVTGKADDGLNTINEFLKSATDKIGPNFVLFVALLNGALIGLVTTGFLGESSISVRSATFFLIIWQFILTCILTARYVDYTINYLGKFLISAMTGYYWQWQFFAMFWPTESFKPPFGDSGFGYILVLSIVILSQIFKGNVRNTKFKYTLHSKKDVA